MFLSLLLLLEHMLVTYVARDLFAPPAWMGGLDANFDYDSTLQVTSYLVQKVIEQ